MDENDGDRESEGLKAAKDREKQMRAGFGGLRWKRQQVQNCTARMIEPWCAQVCLKHKWPCHAEVKGRCHHQQVSVSLQSTCPPALPNQYTALVFPHLSSYHSLFLCCFEARSMVLVPSVFAVNDIFSDWLALLLSDTAEKLYGYSMSKWSVFHGGYWLPLAPIIWSIFSLVFFFFFVIYFIY